MLMRAPTEREEAAIAEQRSLWQLEIDRIEHFCRSLQRPARSKSPWPSDLLLTLIQRVLQIMPAAREQVQRSSGFPPDELRTMRHWSMRAMFLRNVEMEDRQTIQMTIARAAKAEAGRDRWFDPCARQIAAQVDKLKEKEVLSWTAATDRVARVVIIPGGNRHVTGRHLRRLLRRAQEG